MSLLHALQYAATLATTPADARETWPGSANHLVAVALSAVVMFLVIQAGRVRAYRGTEAPLRVRLGIFAIIVWICLNTWYMLPGEFAWDESLPLHICDLANLLAGIVFVTRGRWRWTRAVLYFWAFALTLQGFVTPVVEEGPSDPRYWLFWLNHGVVVAYALYDIAVGGFRPTPRDLLAAVVVSAGYVAVVLPIDIAFGWNYGFLGSALPETGTLLSMLGPWPRRVLELMGLAFVSFVLVYLPWSLARIKAWRSGENQNAN